MIYGDSILNPLHYYTIVPKHINLKDKLELARFIVYSFTGFGVGYELFGDGNRVGFEPEWSIDQAVKNLQWNRTTHTDKKIEGYYNGKMP